MAAAAVKCPPWQSDAVVKYGKTGNGKERFRRQQRLVSWCRSAHCCAGGACTIMARTIRFHDKELLYIAGDKSWAGAQAAP